MFKENFIVFINTIVFTNILGFKNEKTSKSIIPEMANTITEVQIMY